MTERGKGRVNKCLDSSVYTLQIMRYNSMILHLEDIIIFM